MIQKRNSVENTVAGTDLALFGGAPALDQPLHVGRPNLGSRERFLERVNRIFDARWLTNNGPMVEEFERSIAKRVGVEHCISVCNATVGLEMAIRAAGLQGEVILPSMTFVATAHALQWQGITPIFADVDPVTHNIDPRRVEELITERTTGILGVHLWGRPCEVEALQRIADANGLKLLFDAAHAFGCSRGGRMVGGFGDAEVFSFHATKFLNSFEGGAIVTNDSALAERVRLIRNFGFAGYDRVVELGTNGKMSEVSAAMGLTGLESVDEFVQANQRNLNLYAAGLKGVPGLEILRYDLREHNNFQYVIVEVDESAAGLSRDRLVEILWGENVLARRYFHPGCHRMEPYRTLFPEVGARLPETERLSERLLALPTGTAVTEYEIGQVCRVIRTAVAEVGSGRDPTAAALACA